MSPAVGQNSLTPSGEQNSPTHQGNNNLNFRLPRDQAVPLKTAANLCVSRRQGSKRFFEDFFSNFELGDITKHSMTGSVGNSEFRFPRPQCSPQLRSGEH